MWASSKPPTPRTTTSWATSHGGQGHGGRLVGCRQRHGEIILLRTLFLIPVLLAGVLAACTTGTASRTQTAVPVDAAGVRVMVIRDGDNWRADYVFDRDAPAWAFYQSSVLNGTREPWRPRDWTVSTPGVVLERMGDLDVIRAEDGGPVPRRITLRLVPSGDNLEADYPVLIFTDGSVAVPTGSFDIFALAAPDPAGLSDDELTASKRQGSNAHITWKDRAGPVLVHGQRHAEGTTVDGRGYVLFGETRARETDRLVTVADPQLPDWITSSIETFAPRVADYYTGRLGPGQTDRPTIMSTWYGPTPGTTTYGGSVLPGLIVMTFEGQELLASSDAILSENRWFIAHEAAHFWLGQTVHVEHSRESWITEGGADLMAVRAMKALDPSFEERGVLQKEVDDCARLALAPIAGAGQRGEHRAYYACGAVLALSAEAVQRRATGGDWFDFLTPLIEAKRPDGVLTRQAWLAHLSTLGADPTLQIVIQTFLDEGSDDPETIIRELFDRTEVPYRMVDGRIVLD